MDKKTLLVISLGFAIFIGWNELYVKKSHQQTAVAPVAAQAQDAKSVGNATAVTQPATPASQAVILPVSLDTSDVKLSNGGKLISSWVLKDYHSGISKTSESIDLKSVSDVDGNVETVFDEASGLGYLNSKNSTVSQGVNGEWILSYEDENIRWVREISRHPSSHGLLVNLRAQLKKAKASYLFVSVDGLSRKDDPEAQDRQLFYWSDKTLSRTQLASDISFLQVPTQTQYVGVANRYFIFSVINRSMVESKALVQPMGQHKGRVSLAFPITQNEFNIPLQVFFGPKKIDILRAADPTLDPVVDFGWFTAIAYPLLKTLNFLYSIPFVKNYGVAIILLTILLKIVTFPLTYKSMKSMRDMAKIQPQIQKLREKHKDDPQTLNMEMMQLMRSGGYNPVAGCLPILVQMPVFFALYRVLYGSIELYHAPFVGWIQDLSVKDPFFVTPVLLTLTMFFQQKLTPSTTTDPMQAKMLQWMPVFFGVFMISLPSGLTLYMLTNAVVSIIQQAFLNKKLGIVPTGAAKAAAS